MRTTNGDLQREIQEHKATQGALRTAHQRLRDIIEFLPDATFVIDGQRKVIAWNRAIEEMTGTGKEDILGKGDRAYAVPFHGEAVPTMIDMVGDNRIDRSDLYDILERRGNTLHGEGYNPLVYGGRGAYLEALAAPLFDSDGNLFGAIESIHDITLRKKVERDLRESETRLKVLSSRLLTAQEEERKRLARDIHDSLGSVLAGVKISLENLQSDMTAGKTSSQSIDDLIAMTRQAIRECRRIITDMRPSVLDDYGIAVTVGWLCRHFQQLYPKVSIEEKIDVDENEIDASLKTAIFRIIQEALNNIGRHSRARHVNISLSSIDNRVRLAIEDNGIGFACEQMHAVAGREKGFGLTGMRERTELAGGEFFLKSAPGKGTQIQAVWPCRTNGPQRRLPG